MPAYLKILVYLVAVLTAGGLVAPWVFWGGQALAEAGVTDWLAKFPFHRVLSRSVQISALVLLWPALRWIGLRRVADLGLERNLSAGRDLMAGLLLSIGIVALLAVFYVLAGLFVLVPSPEWNKLWRIVLTAIAVGSIEEFVFRGVILGLCLWSLRPAAAIAVSTLLFAVLHFLKPGRSALQAGEVHFWSGWTELTNFAAAWPETPVLLAGMASLLVAGWILGAAAVRTHSLWMPIGLHAGWVFAQQTSQVLLRPAPEEVSSLWPWVGPNLVSGAVPTGVLPLVALGLTGLLVGFYFRHVFRPVATRVA
ncbi:MAG: CPBP family intramembrane glutamic endopeptidase [Chthoniobacterales bacterium]